MTAAIIFAITIVLPNLFLMGLGFFMQRRGEASQAFIDQASSFVFNYCLPCLLFFSVVDSEVDYAKQMILIMGGNDVLAANILAFTTVVGMFGMAIGAAILRVLGWI